jgi:23S rRNA pseudouridine1911/1915/1917 synthase
MEQSQHPQIREIEADESDIRLDLYLAKACPELSRSLLQKLIAGGSVSVNRNPARASKKLKLGDRIVVAIPVPGPAVLDRQDIPFELVYSDTDFIVINKPAGLTVHPGPGHGSGTLVNALIKEFPDLEVFGSSLRPGIVHRLDKDTSGLMVIARNENARQHMIAQFKSQLVKKRYLVLVKGRLLPLHGIIDAPIGRHPSQRQRMAVVSAGRNARTLYRVKKHFSGYTLVEAEIETGRTHQIRVHFAAIGYPVAGDSTYGVNVPFINRQFLHACRLEFKPIKGEKSHVFTSDLPEDLQRALLTLEDRSVVKKGLC